MDYKNNISLFIPGHRPGELEKAFHTSVSTLIIDLFKTVPVQEQCSARYLVAEALEEFKNRGKMTVLWIPWKGMNFSREDLIMLPKKGVDRIRVSFSHYIEELEEIEAILENSFGSYSAPGIELVVDHIALYERLEEICQRCRRVKTLTIGVFDLWNSLPATAQTPEKIIEIKQNIVRIAQAYDLIPIDSVHINYLDLNRFEEDCRVSRDMGFCGRPVVHPSQIKAGMKIYYGGV